MMPKIDGYAVCEMIRQKSNIPIVIVTAMDEEDDQIKAFEMLVDDYITKPFSPVELDARIRRCIH
ncbi:Transcriptional activator protein CzcR [compost metagenome]